jgi:hypothetical protein
MFLRPRHAGPGTKNDRQAEGVEISSSTLRDAASDSVQCRSMQPTVAMQEASVMPLAYADCGKQRQAAANRIAPLQAPRLSVIAATSYARFALGQSAIGLRNRGLGVRIPGVLGAVSDDS